MSVSANRIWRQMPEEIRIAASKLFWALSLPDQIVDELLKEYLLHEHRAVIISFLELLNIPHADGMIDESFDIATLSDEQVQQAARSLLGSADRMGAVVYLKYLVLQGGPWAAVEEVLAAEE